MILLLSLAADMTLLALESQTIIRIRLARLSLGGPAAMVEAERMVSEKVLAFGEAATTLVTGGSPHDVRLVSPGMPLLRFPYSAFIARDRLGLGQDQAVL